MAYFFLGNIRELENILECLYVLCFDCIFIKVDLLNWIVSFDFFFLLKLEDVIKEYV